MKRSALILILFTTLCFPGLAQDDMSKVQWACEIIEGSEEYKTDDYANVKALGAPDVFGQRPRPSSNSFLFGWREKEDDETPTEASLTVKFCMPAKANRVLVAENCAPGAITGIYLLDESGAETRVYTATAQTISAPKRMLQVTFPFTSYKVAGVRITGNPNHDQSWNGIDGIGIAESATDLVYPQGIENVGPKVNSKLSELAPRISSDGKTLYFTREAHPDNVGMGRLDDDQDIWVSTQDADGEWQEAVHWGRPLNNGTYNWLISITPDGNTAILSGRYASDGSPDGSGVSVSRRIRDGWSMPEPFEIIDYRNDLGTADFFMSNDQQVMLFSVKGKKCRGEHDLYVSFYKGGNTYSAPLNLGDVLNTRDSEVAPFLAADGVTLYFSSDGHGGMGNNDIFVTKRLDDTWLNWSEPVNLGETVNSPDYDSDFTLSAQGDYAYFVSYSDSYGEADISRVKLAEEVRPNPVVLISGRVLNQKTGEPIGTEIKYEMLPLGGSAGDASSDPNDGRYKITLPYGKDYSYHAEAEGFYPVSAHLDLTKLDEYTEIEQDLFLVPIEVGEVVRLNNIFFESGKSELLDASFPELDRVVKIMADNPSMTIALAGHTDDVGSNDDNLQLSDRRSGAVSTYLQRKGIAAKRLTSKGYGESQPVAGNDTPEGRQQNRRVEFTVITK